MCCLNKHTHTNTEPAADDSLGKAVHVGTAGYVAKPVHNEEKKRPQSKYAQKYPHTLRHTEMFLSLCSAAISPVSLRSFCLSLSRSDCCSGLWSNQSTTKTGFQNRTTATYKKRKAGTNISFRQGSHSFLRFKAISQFLNQKLP